MGVDTTHTCVGGGAGRCIQCVQAVLSSQQQGRQTEDKHASNICKPCRLLVIPSQTNQDQDLRDMHFDKAPKEKPCYTLPTVKKLLEQKRKRETSSGLTSYPPNTTGLAGHSMLTQLQTPEQLTCAGASSNYTDMPAMTRGQWAPMQEPALSYDPNQPGPSFPVGYEVPMDSDFNLKQQLQGFVSQSYDCLMEAADQGAASTWPPLEPSQALHSTFGSWMDAGTLEKARMLMRDMDYSRIIGQDEDGDTILHIYTAKGLREWAFAAAEKLRDLEKLDAKEHKGKTALLVAVTANQPDIVEDLLSFGADINACDVKGQSALHLAAHDGLPRILQIILTNRPAVNLEARDFEGMTPLHCAAISHCVTMKALFACEMADANLQAKAAEKLSCVQVLLNAGASPLSQEIKSSKTVLHLAVKEGNVVLLHYLFSIPMHNVKDFVNMKAHGHTALHMAACLHGNPRQEEILRLLLSKGADPSIRNMENGLPAHLLQGGPKGEQLKHLLKKRSASTRRRLVALQDQE
ncbi:NF-kappa-B inhibitor delta isoform X2 [Hippocampus zosterae]|uniref:NF-kappa-B inhibitor delta isoform X2 n=1 Tax=Hippocampus zosterae TaxID=109293 RepID=UPI00223CDEEB|nr:NF-kappa-B inhibitor delta isoform X2 [Hippocampus zosterae]